jgi:hypothetical protein
MFYTDASVAQRLNESRPGEEPKIKRTKGLFSCILGETPASK